MSAPRRRERWGYYARHISKNSLSATPISVRDRHMHTNKHGLLLVHDHIVKVSGVKLLPRSGGLHNASVRAYMFCVASILHEKKIDTAMQEWDAATVTPLTYQSSYWPTRQCHQRREARRIWWVVYIFFKKKKLPIDHSAELLNKHLGSKDDISRERASHFLHTLRQPWGPWQRGPS